MKRVASREDPPVRRIPLIVGVAIVRLEPQAVLVVVDVEDVQVAVGVRHKYADSLPKHRPLISLRAVSNS